MVPFKKILVPTDYSKHSAEAIRCAADLARRYEASITLVYVFEPVTYALPEGHVMQSPPQLQEMQSAFEQRLKQAAADAKAAGAPRSTQRSSRAPSRPSSPTSPSRATSI